MLNFKLKLFPIIIWPKIFFVQYQALIITKWHSPLQQFCSIGYGIIKTRTKGEKQQDKNWCQIDIFDFVLFLHKKTSKDKNHIGSHHFWKCHNYTIKKIRNLSFFFIKVNRYKSDREGMKQLYKQSYQYAQFFLKTFWLNLVNFNRYLTLRSFNPLKLNSVYPCKLFDNHLHPWR